MTATAQPLSADGLNLLANLCCCVSGGISDAEGQVVNLSEVKRVGRAAKWKVGACAQICTFEEYTGFTRQGYQTAEKPEWVRFGGTWVAKIQWADSWIDAKYLVHLGLE